MHPFTLLVKPASADCNLRCRYCFYLPKSSLYPERPDHRMDDVILEKLIQSYMETEQPVHSICWQGGEPTLMGEKFFSKVVELQKRYGRPGARVNNSVQTNATLINDEMAGIFAQYRFLVGCSLDGPDEMHDLYRLTSSGKGSHSRVMRGLEILRKRGVDFNVLTLVSRANVNNPSSVYRYLMSSGFKFHQYIPCIELDSSGNPFPFSITGEEWGRFISGIFDEWYPEDIYSVSVRNFDSILAKKVDGVNNVCTMGDNCCSYLVVEHNGDIYPCDFFVEERFLLGNIMDSSWEDILSSEAYREFGAMKRMWNSACSSCEFLDLCSGDCLKNRLYNNNKPENISIQCNGLRHFFEHTGKRFDILAEKIIKSRKRNIASAKSDIKIGRNDPCICGSKLKFKKCCGR